MTVTLLIVSIYYSIVNKPIKRVKPTMNLSYKQLFITIQTFSKTQSELATSCSHLTSHSFTTQHACQHSWLHPRQQDNVVSQMQLRQFEDTTMLCPQICALVSWAMSLRSFAIIHQSKHKCIIINVQQIMLLQKLISVKC